MNKIEFLSVSLNSGLIYDELIELKSVDIKLKFVNFVWGKGKEIKYVKPIVRPFDLTKEIEQNEKKFIPIVELLKISQGNEISGINIFTSKESNVFGVEYIDLTKNKCVFVYNKNFNCFGSHYVETGELKLVIMQLEMFQKLIEWHFDLIDEDCEKIYVTEEFNPYK